MPENKRFFKIQEGLIAELHPRKFNIYYILDAEIDNVASKTLYSEICIFLASLMLGAFLNTWLIKGVNILFWVFLVATFLFSIFSGRLLFVRNKTISNVKKISKLKLA